MNPIHKWAFIGFAALGETWLWFYLGGPIYTIMAIIWGGMTAVWFAGPFILRAQYNLGKERKQD